MNKYIISLSLLFLTVFTSCQKEVAYENGNSNNNTNNFIDSNYLDKIYQVDMNGGAYDTVGVWIYNYDNLNRVSSMILQSYDPTVTDDVTYTYFYSSSDTLPYKTVYIENSNASSDTTSIFHAWDINGRNLQDSSVYTNSGSPYYLVRNYSYGNNLIYGEQHSDLSGLGTIMPLQKDTATTDSYGNILLSKKYYYNTATNNWEITSTTSYTNDAKRSPFSLLSNFKTFKVFPSGETFYYELPGYYNITSQTETNSIETGNPYTNSFTHINVYNSKNQLSVVTINGTYSSSTPDTSRLIFTYKSL